MLKSEIMRSDFSLKRSQNVFRALILFGVLAGLLFSGAEGIHLLPFPAEASAAENLPLRVKTGKEIVYQKNVHRFESKRGDYFSNDERGDSSSNAHNYAGIFNSSDHPAFSFAAILSQTDSDFYARCLKSRLIAASKGSRAPPSFA